MTFARRARAWASAAALVCGVPLLAASCTNAGTSLALQACAHVHTSIRLFTQAEHAASRKEALAKALLARRFTDRIIVASFLDAATDAFAVFAPSIATSAGPTAVAAFHEAVRGGAPRPSLRHVALQVPARVGDAVVVDEAFVAAAHADGVACVIGDAAFRATSRVRSLTPEPAQGLAFDLVVLIDPQTFGTGIEGAVDRYVAMTRATRQLVILTTS